jgi:hypothetical protein
MTSYTTISDAFAGHRAVLYLRPFHRPGWLISFDVLKRAAALVVGQIWYERNASSNPSIARSAVFYRWAASICRPSWP